MGAGKIVSSVFPGFPGIPQEYIADPDGKILDLGS
jgi:hypothetical protein